MEKIATIKVTMLDGSIIWGEEYLLPNGNKLEVYEQDPYTHRPDIMVESAITHIRRRISEAEVKEIRDGLMGNSPGHPLYCYSLTVFVPGDLSGNSSHIPPFGKVKDNMRPDFPFKSLANFFIAKTEFFRHTLPPKGELNNAQ